MFTKLENETLIISHGNKNYTIIHESGLGASVQAKSMKVINIDGRYQGIFNLDDEGNQFVHVECITLNELDRLADFLNI